jgi:2-keto-4-pentenoate hydratase/2-oxohepta-3-ene-1,7-dioic acid hydratase in catechol pathway
MRILRFLNDKREVFFGCRHPNGNTTQLAGDIYGEWRDTGETVRVEKLLAPVAPINILGIGRNYRLHATEGNSPIPEYPVLFMKAVNAVQNPEDPILLPTYLESHEVDYECELAVVIGKKCKNVSRDEALQNVLGYTCANDVSARDWQVKKGGGQWCRGKTFDTFAPLGPYLVTTDEIPNPNELQIKTILNGQVMQDWNTRDMIFDVLALIEFLSGSTTLLPGTVILTGTPHGVGGSAQASGIPKRG